MISVSTTYNNIISGGGHYEWQIKNGSNTWTKENIISGSLEYSVFRTLSIGGTDSAQLDLTLWNVTVDTSSPLVLQFRAVSTSGTTSSWYTKGTYYIDKLESSPYSEQTSITAFDAMLKAEVTYMITGQWTTRTALSVVNTIASEIGVTVATATRTLMTNNSKNLVNSPEIGENGTTDREMLSYIGALYGGNWRINASNQLELVLLYQTPSNTATVGNAVSDFDASKAETISKVRVWVSTNGYYLSPPLPLQTHTLEDILTHANEPIAVYATLFENEWNTIEGAYIEANIPFYGSQAVAENLQSLFVGKSYIPYNTDKAFVDPKYEVGDGITIKDVTSIIATQTIDIGALAVSSLRFEPQGELESLYPYVNKETRQIQFQLSQNTALVDALGQTVSGANYRQQTIYMSVVSVTDAPEANTTWVTDNSGQQNVWTTKRPVYSSSYPVLFVATQRQTVGQQSGNSCSCTTPSVDQTTTVIDGGHITTGTIDAGQVNVINIDASNIDTGTLSADRIGANSIAVSKLTGSISNGGWSIDLDNGTMTLGTLTVGLITGNIANGNWKIDFDNGSFSIGNISANNITTGTLSADRIASNSLGVGKLSGSITNGGWEINLTNGTMSIGTLAVGSITGNIANGNWKVDFDNGTFTIGNISANNITTGTLSAARIGANSIAVSKLTGSITNGDWTINLTNGTMTIGTLSADKIKAGTIADDLTTPKNYWNLTTGQFVTTQGTLGGFTIDANGLSASNSSGVTSYTPNGMSIQGVEDQYGNPVPIIKLTPSGLQTGILNSAGTAIRDDSIIQLASTAYPDPITGEPAVYISQLGNAFGTWGITLSSAASTSNSTVSLTATNINLNGTVSASNVFTTPALTGVADVNSTSLIGYFFAQASVVSNLPTSNAGRYYFVICEGTVQRAIRYGNTGALGEYVRYYTNGRWYPWIKMSEGILTTYAPSTLSGLNSNLVGAIGDMAYPQKRTVWINQSASITPFGTTKFFVDIYKQNDSYAVLKAYQVSGSGSSCYEYRASYFNGSINTWVAVSS